jgi:hypothetical protein
MSFTRAGQRPRGDALAFRDRDVERQRMIDVALMVIDVETRSAGSDRTTWPCPRSIDRDADAADLTGGECLVRS